MSKTMPWRVTAIDDQSHDDREIARGTLEECARALLQDETALVDAYTDMRTYWLDDGQVKVEVVKGGGAGFFVNDAERVMPLAEKVALAGQVSAALEAAGGNQVGRTRR
jgi:hypothetical protein